MNQLRQPEGRRGPADTSATALYPRHTSLLENPIPEISLRMLRLVRV